MKRFRIIKKNLLLNSIAIFTESVDGPALLATCKRSLNQFEHVYLAHQKRTSETSFRRQPVQKITHISREFVEFCRVIRPFYFPGTLLNTYIRTDGALQMREYKSKTLLKKKNCLYI